MLMALRRPGHQWATLGRSRDLSGATVGTPGPQPQPGHQPDTSRDFSGARAGTSWDTSYTSGATSGATAATRLGHEPGHQRNVGHPPGHHCGSERGPPRHDASGARPSPPGHRAALHARHECQATEHDLPVGIPIGLNPPTSDMRMVMVTGQACRDASCAPHWIHLADRALRATKAMETLPACVVVSQGAQARPCRCRMHVDGSVTGAPPRLVLGVVRREPGVSARPLSAR